MRASHTTARGAITELREHLAGLERDSITLRSDLARLGRESANAECAAMTAVRNGDDWSAREHLRAQARISDVAGVVRAELMRVEGLVTVCREALATHGDGEHARVGPP